MGKKKPAAKAKPAAAKKATKPQSAKPKAAANLKAAVAKKSAAPKPAKPKAVAKPKPKTPAKPKTVTTAKSPPKPKAAKKPKPVSMVAAVLDEPAQPIITSPADNDSVPAGEPLTVNVDTNRGGLGYIVRWTDTTTPGAPVDYPVPEPAGTSFSVGIEGSDINPGLTYEIYVYVDPSSGATPPNETDTIHVTT